MEDIKKLYEIYSNDVYKYIYPLTLDKDTSEDIMQNTFVSAIKSINTFKGHSSVKTWLIAVGKNEYYTYLRKNPKNNFLEDINFDQMIYIEESCDNYLTIMEEISKFEELPKQISILRLINELSFKEIGEIIGKSENYCRVSFFRSKQKLVEALRSE